MTGPLNVAGSLLEGILLKDNIAAMRVSEMFKGRVAPLEPE